ncbi:MAG: ATP-binding protein [Chthoniobacterales bacterium]
MINERTVLVNCLPGVVKLSGRLRLLAMALAIAALVSIILVDVIISRRELGALRQRISAAQIESFQIADKLQAAVLNLNATLLRFTLGHSQEDWQKFLFDAEALQRWLAQQHPSNSRGRQDVSKVLSQLAAYDAEAKTIAADNSSEHRDVLPTLSRIESSSQKILSLGYDLANAHRAATVRLVADSQRSLTLLQRIIFVALALVLALGALVIAIFYREMVAPLQRKLVESRTMIERQEKLASLGVLAAGVAHEIRNPLTAIKARLFTLNKAIKATPSAVEDAGVIEREINRLEHIVRAVLSFARPTEPKQQLMAATALLRDVQELMSAQLSKANIELTIEALAESMIQVDPNQLKQVLLNLVQNAADSIEEHGKIVLRAAVERANLDGRAANVAVLEVQDNGKGISVEAQKRLFDPFYTTKPSGTGLGLSIAARIIERHGGALRYESEVGHGTTFGILLPLRKLDEN